MLEWPPRVQMQSKHITLEPIYPAVLGQVFTIKSLYLGPNYNFATKWACLCLWGPQSSTNRHGKDRLILRILRDVMPTFSSNSVRA